MSPIALAGAPAVTAAHERARRSITIMLEASVAPAMAAFGPIAEQEWSPEWRPVFVYPKPAAEISGAIFTVGRPPQYWLLRTWDVRRHIGMVLQENHMFNETIARNISFGDPGPGLDRVRAAAQAAAAHDFIMRLPMGYETKIGESGLAISGGQKQRIAIGRAIYNNPPILIFDEATSALDTESERAIQNNLGRIMAGRTTIAIAHRLSTIREADSIVVLEKGSVAEIGSHAELMAQRGLYFYLSSQQMGVGG